MGFAYSCTAQRQLSSSAKQPGSVAGWYGLNGQIQCIYNRASQTRIPTFWCPCMPRLVLASPKESFPCPCILRITTPLSIMQRPRATLLPCSRCFAGAGCMALSPWAACQVVSELVSRQQRPARRRSISFQRVCRMTAVLLCTSSPGAGCLGLQRQHIKFQVVPSWIQHAVPCNPHILPGPKHYLWLCPYHLHVPACILFEPLPARPLRVRHRCWG